MLNIIKLAILKISYQRISLLEEENQKKNVVIGGDDFTVRGGAADASIRETNYGRANGQ